jgi:precorrin-2 dehydrogenase/sirohydrochlorin ferrochelatase
MLEGASLTAVVIGGGEVATRKVQALVSTGAQVRVVAPTIAEALEALAARGSIEITRAGYSSTHIGDALLVIAATDDPATNSRVAADAREHGRLVNVAGAPDEGNCTTPAVHRAGDVVVAVSAGGVPMAAARIRDAIGRRIDVRYADAIRQLSAFRRASIDGGRRDQWSSAAVALIGDDFCASVESGAFSERAAEWR